MILCKRTITGIKYIILLVAIMISFVATLSNKNAYAADCCTTCNVYTALCSVPGCGCQSITEVVNNDIPHIVEELRLHQDWFITDFWDKTILDSMVRMTEEITVTAYEQINIIGTFFDAKHQLETQRLFQELMAQSHKDYQPSEGMCQFGTTTRSLAASDNNANFNQVALSARGLQRQLLSGEVLSSEGIQSDITSRYTQFRQVYCNPADNGNGLTPLCASDDNKGRWNKDVNFHITIDDPISLEVDFTPDANGDHSPRGATEDEEDVLALAANLYSHNVIPHIPPSLLDFDNEKEEATWLYMDARAIAAKRSVAQAAYSAQAGMKSQGEEDVQHYMQAIMEEMGIDGGEALDLMGLRPSYYAQMEFLTKKIYQHPKFYTELYDKPANIDRKDVSMRAIGLMQKRDIYRTLLRSEAIMAVWLETMVEDLQKFYTNEATKAKDERKLIDLPADTGVGPGNNGPGNTGPGGIL